MKSRFLALCGLAIAACETSVTDSDGGGGAGGAGEGGSGASTSSCAVPAGPPEFAIGTGEDCFEPLASGQPLKLLAGPQGGYHVWLAVGCSDCGPSLSLEWLAEDPATNELLEGAFFSQQVVDLSGEWPSAAGLIVGLPGSQYDEQSPPLPLGTRFQIHVKTLSQPVHEAVVEVEVGEIEQWNPCAEDPNHPLCGFG